MIYLFPCKPKQIFPDTPEFDKYDKDPEWVAEPKLNGWRMEVYRDDKDVTVWTRHHTLIPDFAKKAPHLYKAFLRLPHFTVLDGEWLDRNTDIKGHFYFFETLIVASVTKYLLRYKERRPIIEGIKEKFFADVPEIIVPTPIHIGKKKFFYDLIATDSAAEGIVMKNLEKPHPVNFKKSIDTPYWIKVKKPNKHAGHPEVGKTSELKLFGG
jgi:ATP-dependent DNA ligase